MATKFDRAAATDGVVSRGLRVGPALPGDRVVAAVDFHSFRRAFSTALAEAGVSAGDGSRGPRGPSRAAKAVHEATGRSFARARAVDGAPTNALPTIAIVEVEEDLGLRTQDASRRRAPRRGGRASLSGFLRTDVSGSLVSPGVWRLRSGARRIRRRILDHRRRGCGRQPRGHGHDGRFDRQRPAQVADGGKHERRPTDRRRRPDTAGLPRPLRVGARTLPGARAGPIDRV